ncbi:hypothetical protein DH2020_019496 [Rehmannia glutinosa]|uniref:Protein kinase domain-containing protein n=1 Tax=Rehmannia glutinosa TaxID=99300 RepID=A0ABR0WN90_REHGL
MASLKFLVLAYNQFTGSIPSEYGNFSGIQALDLSFNNLNGSIPSSLGSYGRFLWLMLANNSLTGEIPRELGQCSSLLWLNLANNQLSGAMPPQLANIGSDATPRLWRIGERSDACRLRECLAMMRWIPADYPPFSFVYKLLTRKKCRSLWDNILKGYGLFQVCLPGSSIRTTQISGYVQLSGNRLSGEIPVEIGKMLNFSMLHLGMNLFDGRLPSEIGRLPLVVLNISRNVFSGEIPAQIGNLKCLMNLDLSYNNFSGAFPASLNKLSDLTKFNISYNPYISGVIPGTGQLATFEKSSFLGDPLLRLPTFIDNATNVSPGGERERDNRNHPRGIGPFLVVLALILAFLVCGAMTLIVCLLIKSPIDSPGYLLENSKEVFASSSSSASSPWTSNTIKVIRLDKMAFTHSDILKATRSFSDERIIGRGGSGTVYRGSLPDGREVAIKKLQTEGVEGEREFRAEMEVLSGQGFGWPHPNLVPLYGWCLNGSEKLLVVCEYMEGGSLEDLITDRIRFNWRRRMDVALGRPRALVFLHHECFPSIVHRDVKASNVLLDKNGKARVTDFGLARVVDDGGSHVSTMVMVRWVRRAEYGQTWQAATKGGVYSYGVLAMELATGRRAVDGGEECLVEWAKRVIGDGRVGFSRATIPVAVLVSGLADGAEKMSELLRIGIWCTAESPHCRPNMKEVLAMLFRVSCSGKDTTDGLM